MIKMMNNFNINSMWKNGLLVISGFGLTIGLRSISTKTGKTKFGPKHEWHLIDWKKSEAVIKDLQEKIVIATLNNDYVEMYRLQWKLLSTKEAKYIAIRKVITNTGGKTPGVDEEIWNGPTDYMKAVKLLEEGVRNPSDYKAKPLRRVWIPKGNSKELRPLGIPTVFDRAMQAIYHLAVDPAVETKSDPNSYGFRKNRSTQEAITAIRSLLDKKHHPSWILEADIAKCFDRIDHDFLMKHTPICHKMVLKQWLKAGVMEEMNYLETDEGTPQGGIISPMLCNVALNGIEKIIIKANPYKKGLSSGVHIIRYADDMVITSKNREIAMKNKQLLNEFLKERGLELNENKTLITHIKEGFNFLGFNIRRREWNARLNQATDQDSVLIIKPSEKGINKLKTTLNGIITMNRPIKSIIAKANPVLRGWGEHKRISYHSQAVFIKLDHWIYTKMMKWVHWHKGSKRKVVSRYLVPTTNRKWNWGLSKTEKLINLGEISIITMRPLSHSKNPYKSEDLEYFDKRKEKLIEAKFRHLVYKLFEQRCPLCKESLHNGETVELHHIEAQKAGGKWRLDNIVPLHQICHQQITHGDQSLKRFKIEIPKIEKRKRKPRVKKKETEI